MITLSFEHEVRYAENKALVPVMLVGTRPEVWVDMTLDTGSEISLLNRDFGTELGLEVTEGTQILLEVANGESAAAWLHNVEVEVLGRKRTIEVAFCPDWDTKNLLGMRGLLDQMIVAFDHARNTLYV